MNNQLAIFENKPIRRVEHEGEMYFSVVDVIDILTETSNSTRYWHDLKRKANRAEGQPYDFIVSLKLTASDGRKRLTDCANTEGVFRILMSVPSPKAEPLKLWLASLGKQAIDETENPELLTERQIELYKAKGYPDEWIKRRVQAIETRQELTDEWKKRGVTEGVEYAILTATIAKGTFGLNPSEHSKLKGLARQNLRDHMTPMELILTAFSEEATRQVAVRDDAQGFNENHDAAQLGGRIGGDALKNFEAKTGLTVVSGDNFLGLKNGDVSEELPEGNK